METTETKTRTWHESDGTEVIETITIKRISPTTSSSKSNNNSSTIIKSSSTTTESKNNDKDTGKNSISSTLNKFLHYKNENNDDNNLQFQIDSLNRHNYYREKHGVPKLVLSKDLCKYAQEWANKIAKSNTMQHRSDNKYGENIFAKGGTNVTIHGNDAVDAWYEEISKYDFNSPGFKPGIGHFTQVVWRDSKQLGIAYAKHGDMYYVVANYDPPGNFRGEFADNVPKLI